MARQPFTDTRTGRTVWLTRFDVARDDPSRMVRQSAEVWLACCVVCGHHVDVDERCGCEVADPDQWHYLQRRDPRWYSRV